MRPPRLTVLLATGLFLTSSTIVALFKRHTDLRKAYFELRTRASRPYRGYVVPTFRAGTVSGDSVTIGELPDSLSRQLVFVFNTTCPYCKATLPLWALLADSARRQRSVHVTVVALSLDSLSLTLRYAADHRVTYTTATFPSWKTAMHFRAIVVPLTLVLDHRGRVLYAHAGLLEGKPTVDSLYRAIRGELSLTPQRRTDSAGVRSASTDR